MNVERSLKYVFEDKQWVSKLIIAVVMSLLAFLIIPGLFITGYMIAIIRRVMNGEKEALPAWDNWGQLLRDGFFATVAALIYALPFILLFMVAFAGTIGFGSMSDMNSDIASAGLMGTFGLVGCLGLIMGIALLFIIPAVYIQYAIKDEFGACFRFGEVFGIARQHMADILITVVVTVVAGFALSLVAGVLGIIPCLGWIAAAILSLAVGPYIMMVTGHLYGQIAAKVLGAGTPPKYLPDEPTLS